MDFDWTAYLLALFVFAPLISTYVIRKLLSHGKERLPPRPKGQGMLILSSHTAAADLLDRRANIYSDRPRLIVASEILTGGLIVTFAKYTKRYKRTCRSGHEGLNKSIVPSFHLLQIKEALILIEALLRNSDN